MKRPFSAIAAALLVAMAVVHAMRLWFGWTATLAGADVPMSVSVAGIGVALALALGLWFEGGMHAALAAPDRAATAQPTRGTTPTRAGKKFTVRKGKRYRAVIALGFFEQVASNDTIAGMLADAGFKDVVVTGTGARRTAEALWSGEDASAEMPSQIVTATEIETTVAAGLAETGGATTRGAPPTRGSKRFTVKKGRRYRATIALGFFEQVASNETIAGMFTDAGFSDVEVNGSGGKRIAEGLWPGEDATADMPSQVVSAVELETQVAAALPTPAAVPSPPVAQPPGGGAPPSDQGAT